MLLDDRPWQYVETAMGDSWSVQFRILFLRLEGDRTFCSVAAVAAPAAGYGLLFLFLFQFQRTRQNRFPGLCVLDRVATSELVES